MQVTVEQEDGEVRLRFWGLRDQEGNPTDDAVLRVFQFEGEEELNIGLELEVDSYLTLEVNSAKRACFVASDISSPG